MKNGVSNANVKKKKKKVLIMISLTIVFHVHQSHFFFWFSPLPWVTVRLRGEISWCYVKCNLRIQPSQSLLSRLDFSLLPAGDQAGGRGGGGRRGLGLSNDVSQLAVTYRAVQRIIAIFFPSHFFRSEKRTGTFAIDKLIEMEYRR